MTDEQREALNFIAEIMEKVESDFIKDTIDDYTRQIIFLLVKKMTDHDIFVDYHISRITLELAALLAIEEMDKFPRIIIHDAFMIANGLLPDARKS